MGKLRHKKKHLTTPKGISLRYEDMGKKSHSTIILIMGLGAQLTLWPQELCEELVHRGFRVVRFDNRDAGKSSQLDEYGNPSIVRTWLKKRMKMNVQTPYQLRDMADDVIDLMDGLNIKKAHIVGASMGGMIGQILAAKYRKRVLSFTSIMSSTSCPKLPRSKLRVLVSVAQRPNPKNRNAAIEYSVRLNKLIGSPAYRMNDEQLYQRAEQNYDREGPKVGYKRQLAAIAAEQDRSQLIRKIKAPTLVIHGDKDPLVPLAGGIDTAEKIHNARLKVISGMGHDIPPALAPKLAKLIAKHAKKVDKKRLIQKT